VNDRDRVRQYQPLSIAQLGSLLASADDSSIGRRSAMLVDQPGGA
jgi:hypothetical protein